MDFDFEPVLESWRFLLSGLWVTLLLSVVCAGCSLVLGAIVGLGRIYGPRPLRAALTFYIDSMRAIPVLVVLVWIYFAVPILSGVTFEPFWAAVVALTIHLAAYAAEILRAGIESIRPGQVRAALALA